MFRIGADAGISIEYTRGVAELTERAESQARETSEDQEGKYPLTARTY